METRVAGEKAAHLSSLRQGDRSMKLSFSFAPLVALLPDSQLNPHQPSAPVSSNAGFGSETLDSFEIYIMRLLDCSLFG